MASQVFKNALFLLNGTDLTCQIQEATLNYASEMLDNSTICSSTRTHKGGLYDWSVDVTFLQDFTAGSVDATLFNLVGTTACFELRPTNACSSANNPIYSGIVTLANYTPVSGSVGALLQSRSTFQSAGTLSRASSS